MENGGNSIARFSNAMHFNYLELLKCFIQTQGKGLSHENPFIIPNSQFNTSCITQ